MKKHPELQDERLRLLERLEAQRQQIKADVEDFKSALEPLNVAKQVVRQAADTFRDNNFATQSTRLALTMLPGRFMYHPLVRVAAQIAVPLVLRNWPKIVRMVQEKTDVVSVKGIKETWSDTRHGIRKAWNGLF